MTRKLPTERPPPKPNGSIQQWCNLRPVRRSIGLDQPTAVATLARTRPGRKASSFRPPLTTGAGGDILVLWVDWNQSHGLADMRIIYEDSTACPRRSTWCGNAPSCIPNLFAMDVPDHLGARLRHPGRSVCKRATFEVRTQTCPSGAALTAAGRAQTPPYFPNWAKLVCSGSGFDRVDDGLDVVGGRFWPSGGSSRSGTAGGRHRSRTRAWGWRCWSHSLDPGQRPRLDLQLAVHCLGGVNDLDEPVPFDRDVSGDGLLGLCDLLVDALERAAGPGRVCTGSRRPDPCVCLLARPATAG